MKKYLIATLLVAFFIVPANQTHAQTPMLLDEEGQRQCRALCPGFGTDEYVACFKEKCAQLFDQVGEEKTSANEEWKQISIARSPTACEVAEGGNEQFYIMVSSTPSKDYGTNEIDAGILSAGDKFEIPDGNEWSVWLKGTKGTVINLSGGTVMQIPCQEPQGIVGAVWDMIGGTAFFDFQEPAVIQTRTAIAGVKGTRFILTSEKTKTDLYVLEGTVSLTGKDNVEVVATANQYAFATATSTGEVMNFDSLPSHLAQLGVNPPDDTPSSPAPEATTTEESVPTPYGKAGAILLIALALAGALWYRQSRKS